MSRRRDATVYDVVVLGGGIAGASVAHRLAQLGWRVVLVNDGAGRSFFPRILDASSISAMGRLGLKEVFLDVGLSPIVATVSCWNSDAPLTRPAMLNPLGPSWILRDRSLENAIIGKLQELSVPMVIGRMRGVHRVSGQWTVLIQLERHSMEFKSHLLVDASGRSHVLARCQGARTTREDRLVAIARRECDPTHSDGPPLLWVRSFPEGWSYSCAPRPSGPSDVFFTDVDLLRIGRRRRMGHKKAIGPLPNDEWAIVPARSERRTPVAGMGWIAIGDAAQCMDPLQGDGVGRALRHVEAMVNVLQSEPRSKVAGRANDYCQEQWLRFQRDKKRVYSSEGRWPDRPFWKRRRHDN